MVDVALSYRTQLIRQHCSHSHGLAGKRDELHLVSRALTVNVNHRTDIPSLQSLFREVTRQYHTIVFLKNHFSAAVAISTRAASFSGPLMKSRARR